MYSFFVSRVKQALRQLGFEVRRVTPQTDLIEAVRALIANGTDPVVFDVGANIGQSIAMVHRALPGARIHAFEPNTALMAELQACTTHMPNVSLNDIALGASCGTVELQVNSLDLLSSMLPPGSLEQGTVTGTLAVPMETVDSYCARNKIDRIDFLKIDTQGTELDVMRGSAGMIGANKVQLVLTEIVFEETYKGMPRFDEVFGFLADRGFRMAGLYNLHNKGDVLFWLDVLFVSDRFRMNGPG